MNIDPNGCFWITFICVTISTLVSLGSEIYEDYKNDGVIFNGDKNIWDYIGAGASGFISGFGGGFLSTVGLGIVGDVTDALLNGELIQNGFLSTVGISAFSNVIGFGVGEIVGNVARKGTSLIQAKKFVNMIGAVDNNLINRQMRPIANNLNIGAERATVKNISREIYSANIWKTGRNVKDIFASIF